MTSVLRIPRSQERDMHFLKKMVEDVECIHIRKNEGGGLRRYNAHPIYRGESGNTGLKLEKLAFFSFYCKKGRRSKNK